MKQLLLAVVLAVVANGVIAADKAVQETYNRFCFACHFSGAAGAPLAFKPEVWAPRLEQGMEVLLANTVNGINAMPPRGLCADCSDDMLKALIEYMSQPEQ